MEGKGREDTRRPQTDVIGGDALAIITDNPIASLGHIGVQRPPSTAVKKPGEPGKYRSARLAEIILFP